MLQITLKAVSRMRTVGLEGKERIFKMNIRRNFLMKIAIISNGTIYLNSGGFLLAGDY